jgi:hypothetical protein
MYVPHNNSKNAQCVLFIIYLSGASSKITELAISPVNRNYVFVRGASSTHWISKDMGKTYTALQHEPFDSVSLHPTQPEWLLASTVAPGCQKEGPVAAKKANNPLAADPSNACFRMLHMSHDFGVTWRKLLDYVVQWEWSPTLGGDDDLGGGSRSDKDTAHVIYAAVHRTKRGNQPFGVWSKDIDLVRSVDFFVTHDVILPYGNRFMFGEQHFLYVAQVDPEHEQQVKLQIARLKPHKLKFKRAVLPVRLTEHSYTILDSSEGSVFLHVNHQPLSEKSSAGHIYISDWSGLTYSLSLPYSHRNAAGECDFSKVLGLEGVYLANYVDLTVGKQAKSTQDSTRLASKKPSKKNANNKKSAPVKTVITFDKGAEWSFLAPPTHDSLDQKIDCTGDCHLHLHGITDEFGPFYSSKNALGLIISTGNVGRHLHEENSAVNTYLSRDGGVSWREIARGSHIYEFGDHGALVVMAPDAKPTRDILYSWDEGAHWSAIRLSKDPVYVWNIITEIEATSQQFVVYGSRDEKGVMFYVDFADLHERKCSGHDNVQSPTSDFELWTPTSQNAAQCLMGRRTSYVRRKADTLCFNDVEFERPVSTEHCQCTARDFQCDFGYARSSVGADGSNGNGDVCNAIVVANEDAEAKEALRDNLACGHERKQERRITQGYRRVPGDSCIGGEQWAATYEPCAHADANSHAGKLLVGIGLLFLCFCLMTYASRNKASELYVRKLFDRLTGKQIGDDDEDGDDRLALDEDEFEEKFAQKRSKNSGNADVDGDNAGDDSDVAAASAAAAAAQDDDDDLESGTAATAAAAKDVPSLAPPKEEGDDE